MIDCGCDEILLPQGSDGVDGKNAFTVTTASFVQPGVGIPVTITVSDTLQNTNQWAIVNQIIRITDSGGRGGWYQVTGITGTTQITAINLDYQPGSSVAGVTIQAGAGVSPAGLKGVDGQDGGVGLQGPVGPAPNLSIGNVSQLNPGNQPTVQVNGGGGNYTIDFGIPQGFPGVDGGGKAFYQIWGPPLNSPSILVTSTLNSVFYVTIDADGVNASPGNGNKLCPTDGSSFKIHLYTRFYSDDNTDFTKINFQFEFGVEDTTLLNNLQYNPGGVGNTPAYKDPINPRNIDIDAPNSVVVTDQRNTTIRTTITITRTSVNSYDYMVEFLSTDGINGPRFNIYSGSYSNANFQFSQRRKSFKFAAQRSGDHDVRMLFYKMYIENLANQ